MKSSKAIKDVAAAQGLVYVFNLLQVEV